jgi:hypothetical protein
MADWTNLPNTAVGVGGLPSGTTVTALRDNPVAIAEGAAGAPRVQGTARVLTEIGSATISSPVNSVVFNNLPQMRSVLVSGSGISRDGQTGNLIFDFSADNGSTWPWGATVGFLSVGAGNMASLIARTTPAGSFVTGAGPKPQDFVGLGGPSTLFTSEINAVRVRHSNASGNLTAGSISVLMDTGVIE